MHPALGMAMAIKDVTAGIWPVPGCGAVLVFEVTQANAGEALIARCAETIAYHELGRTLLAEPRFQWGHGMQVDKQGSAPLVADKVQHFPEFSVIRLVDRRNATSELLVRNRRTPNLPECGETTRHEPKTGSSAAVGERVACPHCRFSADHSPVDIVGRAIEVDHCPRGFCQEQRGSGLPRYFERKEIDKSVFQPDPYGLVAHVSEETCRVRPPSVRCCDDDR